MTLRDDVFECDKTKLMHLLSNIIQSFVTHLTYQVDNLYR